MGSPELFLEHSRGQNRAKRLRVKAANGMFVIGSSEQADLRIGGTGVEGCHAVLRRRGDQWYICDVSGTESLKVDGKNVSESRVSHLSKVEIGSHRLQLFSKERTQDFFPQAAVAGETSGSALHQVVVRSTRMGRVIETRILKATESFVWSDGDRQTKLAPPSSSQWQITEAGARTIQQRLTSAQEIAAMESLTVDRDLTRSFAVALILFCLLVGSITILSSLTKSANPEVALDNKSMDIIFNAKAVKKKRLESQKIQKIAKGKSGGTTESAEVKTAKTSLPEESQAPKVSAQATKALTSLRNSGLSSLIGKIAKRANKQGIMVAAVGVSPDNANAGRALFSQGTSTTGGGGSAAKEGPSFRLGGIATKGKAGGVGDFKNGTGLAGGSVGTGNVMALMDDEETSIEGGLDRDAIAEVIKRNLGQIRYCYERQLSSNPDLYGKVLVKFVIGADGILGAQKIDNSTLKNDMVEGCILRRMGGWKFPLPKGGTQVRVSYPFLFKALE
jgi:pSer/pThr/pTyr-binding forkhead associated (FHA) protein